MKILLFIFIICINKSFSINGLIWNNQTQTFVPIFSIERFKALQNEVMKIFIEEENYKFNGEEISFVYYHEKDIFEFHDNDRKVTGICGDLWTTLSEYLNFTMNLTKTDIRAIGTRPHPGDNYTGLLGMIERKEYTIIPKMEAFLTRLDVVDFTKSIWKDRHRLFVKPYYEFKVTWMLDLFSWKIWCLIVVFYILLSIFSIIVQRITHEDDPLHLMSTPTDFFFYSFGALCNQGDVLYAVQRKFKIMSLLISLFSWFLLTSFGSQLIIYMTQTILVPPFSNLDTLYENTDYDILAEKFSVVYLGFMKNYRPIYVSIHQANRIHFFTDYPEMWRMACSEDDKYAVLQSEFMKMGGNSPCILNPIGEDYFKTWIVSGIAKDFLHKKTINIGILKLHEFGIIKLLKNRWLQLKQLQTRAARYYAPITLDQIILLLSVYVFGVISSVVIVIIEKIMYFLQRKKNKML